jgi:hypothetical protein
LTDDLLRILKVAAEFALKRGAELSADMGAINAAYHDEITQALIAYFEGGSIAAPKNSFKRATLTAFQDAFDLGYSDGGGELPVDAEANAWLEARTQEEFGNVDALFEQAKELRKDKEFAYFDWVTARADAYSSTAMSVYNSAALMAKKNQMLTWRLGMTETHCSDCSELDGNSHRASWYISHNYIPRKPGSSTACQGFNCDCRLEDSDGNEVTI